MMVLTLCAQRVNTRAHHYNATSRQGLRSGYYTGIHHLVGFHVDGGYMPTISAGVDYEFQQDHFILQTGIAARWQYLSTSVADTTFTWLNQVDAVGEPFDMTWQFYDRRDRAHNCYLEVPLLLGRGFQAKNTDIPGRGYFLAGVKMRYAIAGCTTMDARTTTTGYYHRFNGIISETDNHGFRKDVPMHREGDGLAMRFDLACHAELGYEYARRPVQKRRGYIEKSRLRYRIAGFADVSVLNVRPKAGLMAHYVVPAESKYDVQTYGMTHVWSSGTYPTSPFRNMFFGVKFTMLFQVLEKDGCVICQDGSYNQYRRR